VFYLLLFYFSTFVNLKTQTMDKFQDNPKCLIVLLLLLSAVPNLFVLFLSTANIYDKTVEAVEALGLDSECVGGGRIKHDAAAKKILVYGYSQVISALMTVRLQCVRMRDLGIYIVRNLTLVAAQTFAR
jgi:hypothetical protein